MKKINEEIPHIIHYCWFGRNPKPKLLKKCIKSWKKYMPDFEIKEWNEDNFDINMNKYVKEAYSKKKYAFVSDVARLQIMYEYGGIYLDTDVELLRRIPNEVLKTGYFAKETETTIATGLGFACHPKCKLIKKMLDEYNDISFLKENGEFNLTTCLEHNQNALRKIGIEITKETDNIKGIPVFSSEFFCGYDIHNNHYMITNNTISVHHYNASWVSPKNKAILRVKRIISKIIGKNNYEKIRKLKKI